MSEVTVSPTTTTSTKDPATRRATRYISYFFWVMFVANFVNYLQRWSFAGLGVYIERDLKLNHALFGLLASLFLLIYTIFALPFGLLADRLARKVVMSFGMVVGSIATVLTALSSTFPALIGAKSLFGFGQSGFYPSGTPLLIAQFAPSKRAAVISRWAVGALIGTAIGFLMRGLGIIDPHIWRSALIFIAIPGIVLAVFVIFLREKQHHEEDRAVDQLAKIEPAIGLPTGEELILAKGSTWKRLRSYLGIPTFRTILGMHIFGFFAIAGIAFWLPNYLGNVYGQVVTQYDSAGNPTGNTIPTHFGPKGLDDLSIAILAGGVVIVGGIFGNLYGSRLAARLSRRTSGARILAGGIGFLLSAPFVVLAVGAPFMLPQVSFYASADPLTQRNIGLAVFLVFGLAASFFLNVYNGPTSAALLDIIPAAERGSAGGSELFLAHLLGDVHATFVVGTIAVLFTQQLGGDQLGLAILLTAPIALMIAGIIGVRGSRHYASDVAKLGTTAEAMLGTATPV